MENYSFDQLKNIEVPERFIEKALDIPYAPTPKKHRQFRASLLAGAAAAILMMLVGKTLFLGLLKPHNAIASKTELTPQAITDSVGNTVNKTENSTVGPTTLANPSGDNEQFSQSGETSASEHLESETAESSAVSGIQTEPSEQPHTESTSVPVSTQAQTQPQTVYTEPCTEQATGNTNTSEKTSAAVTNPDGFFMGKLGFVYMNDDYKAPFICTITSPDGMVFGGEMTFTNSGGINTVLYSPLEHGERLKSGNYTVCFYESNSRLILKVSFTAVSNSSATVLFPVGY